MSQKVLNKRCSVIINDVPVLPSSGQIEYGEIAINYAHEHETISILNDNNNIATFTSRTFYSGDVVRVEGATTNDTFTFA